MQSFIFQQAKGGCRIFRTVAFCLSVLNASACWQREIYFCISASLFPVKKFVAAVKKYTDMQELDAAVLREFRMKKKHHQKGGVSFWSGRRGSNSLPRP
ncbi:MAG: DUF4368 domain-containing protein, partial [Butyricicoccus sp.]